MHDGGYLGVSACVRWRREHQPVAAEDDSMPAMRGSAGASTGFHWPLEMQLPTSHGGEDSLHPQPDHDDGDVSSLPDPGERTFPQTLSPLRFGDGLPKFRILRRGIKDAQAVALLPSTLDQSPS